MNSRPFSREDFLAFTQLVADNARARGAPNTYLMTSDVAWQFPGCAPKTNIRLWLQGDRLAAYAWFQPPDNIKFDVAIPLANQTGLVEEVIEWAESKRREVDPSYPVYLDYESMSEWADAIRKPQPQATRDRYLVTSALENDATRINALEKLGFRATRHFEPILVRDLSDIAHQPHDRFSIRSVRDDELEQRVQLHAAAWAPSSGFSLERYQRVRAMDTIFDPDLDLVAVDSSGQFASYTIAWIDPVSCIGSFEPFGTHPEYRGSGASQAVILDAFQRMTDKGMKQARIYTAGFNQPAQRLYENCGFQRVNTSRTMLKKIGS